MDVMNMLAVINKIHQQLVPESPSLFQHIEFVSESKTSEVFGGDVVETDSRVLENKILFL